MFASSISSFFFATDRFDPFELFATFFVAAGFSTIGDDLSETFEGDGDGGGLLPKARDLTPKAPAEVGLRTILGWG